MNFSDFRQSARPLTDLKAICGTLEFRRKVADAQRSLEKLFKLTKFPIVSCGGGKDSTATALLAKSVNPDIYILCANPPNPLDDRAAHNEKLKKFLGGVWVDLPYDWDVDSVLAGKEKYPYGLKMRVLSEFQRDNNIDGVILGIRAQESKGRAMNFRLRGDLYQVEDGWRCTPIVRFTAEESLAVALLFDAPINPVYEKTHLAPSYEYLRDGTWWCHTPQYADLVGGWMKYYYPQHYEDYLRSVQLQGGIRGDVCSY